MHMRSSLTLQGFADFANFGGCRLPDSDFLEGKWLADLAHICPGEYTLAGKPIM